METSKVYIHKNPEGLWEVGVLQVLNGETIYINKHEASTQPEAVKWVEEHYVA